MATTELKSDNLFEMIKFHLALMLKIGIDEVSYVVDLKKGEVTKGAYEGGKPDATFYFKDDDFVKVATGQMNPQVAFMRGMIKIKGSLSAAQKFTPAIFPKPAKM
ncbi:alpha-amylase-like [Hibiscus syriacus]|uniref:Alpha-amylase-like n=1 Tax=Hibiscus syriacus TaxID=106335 RepID=A0A6A3CQW0_HIBSY|nr:alpha-amylase-like [Hibiscus syriacus]